MRKPVFVVFDQVRLKPVCSATETSYCLEILAIETRDRLICAFVVRIWQKQVFS